VALALLALTLAPRRMLPSLWSTATVRAVAAMRSLRSCMAGSQTLRCRIIAGDLRLRCSAQARYLPTQDYLLFAAYGYVHFACFGFALSAAPRRNSRLLLPLYIACSTTPSTPSLHVDYRLLSQPTSRLTLTYTLCRHGLGLLDICAYLAFIIQISLELVCRLRCSIGDSVAGGRAVAATTNKNFGGRRRRWRHTGSRQDIYSGCILTRQRQWLRSYVTLPLPHASTTPPRCSAFCGRRTWRLPLFDAG